jgi:hypothetical protein
MDNAGGGVVQLPQAAVSKEQQIGHKTNILNAKFDFLHSQDFILDT